MRPFRLIILCLCAFFFVGCDSDSDRLKAKNRELYTTIESLSKELRDYRTGEAEAWRAETLFRRELDHSAACKLIFELPFFCPPSLAEARAKVLAQANQKGIAATIGMQYITTLVLSGCGFLMALLVGWVGWIVLVNPTRTGIREREEKINSTQADLEKINRAEREASARLDKVLELVEAEVLELDKVRKSKNEATQAATLAQAQAEQAQAEARELQKSLATLKAFRKI